MNLIEFCIASDYHNKSVNLQEENKKLKLVLNEIREVINQNMSSYSSCIKAFDEIEEILDKVDDLC